MHTKGVLAGLMAAGFGISLAVATGLRRSWSQRPLRAALSICVAAVALVLGQGEFPVARADAAFGSEIVVIDSVTIGTHFVENACGSIGLALPVRVVATFIPPLGSEPVGPYAVDGWNGGTGTMDDHFGNHGLTQVFHLLLNATGLHYRGDGTYTASVIVQDVGLASGYFERDNIPVNVSPGPPFQAPAGIKCPLVDKMSDATDMLKDAAMDYVMSGLESWDCPLCKDVHDAYEAYEIYKEILVYKENLWEEIRQFVLKDPPDSDYEQIASPSPPPLLPPISGLTATEQSTVTALETAVATAIGDLRALSASVDRAWGAANAGSVYWYREQVQAEARFAAQVAGDLRRLPANFDALQALFSGGLPPLPITDDDVSALLSILASGMPSDSATVLTQIGMPATDQQQLAQDLLSGDASQLTTDDAAPGLFAPPQDYPGIASDFDALAKWAAQTVNARRPVVTGLDVRAGPAAGGTQLTVYGSNLGSVTGISFGPSTPAAGVGENLGCSPNECGVTAPPGTGTVDVIADGPGGPSEATPAGRFTYQADTTPGVTRIFPASGSVAGGTSVAVFGSGLKDGRVSFGPQLAVEWTCTAVLCTATTPQSGGPGPVDVTVSNGAGTSATTAADQFTFQATAPPTAQVPTITGVSPASGNSAGGDTVTITGTGFTGATGVAFAGTGATSYTVDDDSHITAITPAGSAGASDVTIFNSAGTSAVTSNDHFGYVNAAPVVTGVSPASGPTTGGTTITVTGTNLNEGSVQIGDGEDLQSGCTPTRCTATTMPAAAGPVDVAVWTDNGLSAAVAGDRFTYVKASAPAVTSIEPASGSTAGGTDIVIYGTNLSGATVAIGGQPAPEETGNGCSLTACTVQTPPGAAGNAPVVVTRTDGTTSAAAAFRYVNPGTPAVTAVTPGSGWLHGLTEAEIFGQNLAGGAVSFGANQTVSTITGYASGCTQGECAVEVPFGNAPGTVDVTVRTPGGTTVKTAADKFTYLFPAITTVSPSNGWTIGGTPVTITGTNLAGGVVSFGGIGASHFSCTATACTGPAPAVSAPGQVDVTVTVDDGNDTSAPVAADHFTYQMLPAPTVTAVSPGNGTDQGGDTVLVTGTYLDGGTVSFGGVQAAAGSCTDTNCAVVSPYASAGSDGTVDVTVTTSAGASAVSPADKFTYHPPGIPTVTGVSPPSGSMVGGTAVTITGTNLTDGSVFFGRTQASGTCTAASTCTVVSPPGSAAGPVDITVWTSAGPSADTPAGQFAYQTPPAPTVASLSPASGPSTGGAVVTVTGANLAGGMIMFGATAAADTSCGPGSCTATQPAGSPGTVDVTVQTPGGTSAASSSGRFTYTALSLSEVSIPGLARSEETGGGQVYTARDGTEWFTMPSLNKIGKIAPDDTMTAYATADASADPDGITQTPDGTVWYTEPTPNKIVSLDSAGNQKGYQIPGQPDDLRDITVGPDGRLWFTLSGSGAIGAMTTSGAISTYPLPDSSSFPLNILTGPDGRLWFTEGYGDALGAITTSGHITEYRVPGNTVSSWGLTAGPDGRLWFTDRHGHEIDAMTTGGAATQYPLPATDGPPDGITSGADGRLWFTEDGFDAVDALDPASGAVNDYPMLNTTRNAVQPKYLAMAKDGSIWASEVSGSAIIHVTGVTSGVPPAVTAVSPNYGPASGGTTVTITGANLTGPSTVTFGTVKAAAVTSIDAAHVTVIAPPGTGAVDVSVITPSGTTAASSASTFYYGGPPPALPQVTGVSPGNGSTAGGEKITIGGVNLASGTVRFGAVAAAAATCIATSCTVTAPAGPAGTTDVRVTTPAGTSAASAADQFTYQAPPPPAPAVTGISPASGPAAGGNPVTITGTNLGGSIVSIGLNDVAAACNATSCTLNAPPGAPGTVDVQVTTAGGTSAVTTADRYSYLAPPSVPSAPGKPTATTGDATATLSWISPKSDGGSAITGYTVIPYRNGVKQTALALGTALSAKITGLSNSASYSFVVEARNAVGTGPASPPSAAVIPRIPTTLAIIAAPAAATYGATVSVTGKVTRTGSVTPVPAVQVSLQYRKHGTANPWTAAGNAESTPASGLVTLKLKTPYSIDIRLVSVPSGVYAAAASPVKTVACSAVITAALSPATIAVGKTALLSGTVAPNLGGTTVYLERLSGKTWIVVASQKLSSLSGYKFTISGAAKGTWSYRIAMKATTSFTASVSAARTLKVT